MEERKPIAILVPPDTKPSFVNVTKVTVSDDSVVIQFAYIRANTPQGTLISEIVLTPKHAIDFNRSLDTTIKKHFTRHLDSGTEKSA